MAVALRGQTLGSVQPCCSATTISACWIPGGEGGCVCVCVCVHMCVRVREGGREGGRGHSLTCAWYLADSALARVNCCPKFSVIFLSAASSREREATWARQRDSSSCRSCCCSESCCTVLRWAAACCSEEASSVECVSCRACSWREWGGGGKSLSSSPSPLPDLVDVTLFHFLSLLLHPLHLSLQVLLPPLQSPHSLHISLHLLPRPLQLTISGHTHFLTLLQTLT